MITLSVEDYCQNCPELEVETERLYAGNDIRQTNLFCEHREKCMRIQNYIFGDKTKNSWIPISEFDRMKYSWILARCFLQDSLNEEISPTILRMGEDKLWYDFYGNLFPNIKYQIRYFVPVPKLSNISK